ncbi:hypothetical protein PVK06_029982 [Gossypium arboreum]|uniref:Retrotransposon gag domain-containing protein n=1 Tax=Gossypium arboreum TaxID=29729 RepID=A0ABR0NM22_GOSAR|nr:hypothetical protein PVK06_029982 [Gossypium arboreum]
MDRVSPRFLQLLHTEDHYRVTIVSFRMDGIAKKWFRWMQRQRQLASWDHLIKAICKQFTVIEIESSEVLYFGSLIDTKNDVLSNRVAFMSEAMALSHFHEARLNDMKRLMGRGVGPKTTPLLPNPLISPTSLHNMPG